MKKWLQIILEAVVAVFLVFILTKTNRFASFDYMVRDGLYQIPRGIDSRIKIIGIDERTLEELGPIQTWSRQQYADLIEVLNSNEDSKPAIIAFDIVFSGHVDEGDIAFADAALESKNVVVVSNLVYEERKVKNEQGLMVAPVESVVYPYEELGEAAAVGYSNVAQDSDGIVRRILPSEVVDGEEQYMFSHLIYKKYCEINNIAEKDIPTDKYGRSLINYSGKPGDYEYISFVDVLNGRVDSRAFKGSIILVGAYAPGMQDNFAGPNNKSRQMYGVEVHANILQSYIQGRFSVNGNPLLFGFVFGLIAGLMHILFRKCKVWQSFIILVLGIGAEVFFCVWLNNHGTAINLVYMPLVCVVSYVYALAYNYLFEKRKRKKVIKAFKKYVAPQVVDEIAKKGDFTIKLGGENRDIAVLFVDIRGFTTMSEALEPEQVVAILNEYLNLTTQAIFKNSGTLDKFVGDATMAVFNSPFDLDDYEFKAVCAAKDIVDGGNALEKELLEKYGRSVGFGVGVHCGPAVVGNVGCEFRMDFTAIGDTVNTSARLEANAKKGQVLISDTLYERLKGRIEVNEIGVIPLKGKANGVFVYEVTDIIRDSKPGDSKEDDKSELVDERK